MLPDYTGELEATTTVRVTDRVGGPASEAATVTDVVFPVTVPCTATATAPGATCAVTTSFDAVVPGTVPEGKRTIWQLEQVRVDDGGAGRRRRHDSEHALRGSRSLRPLISYA